MAERGQQFLVTFIIVFVLGIVAGAGIGYVYGQSVADAGLERDLAGAKNQLETLNNNYLTLVHEYNRLFSLKGQPAPGVAVNPVESETYQVPVAASEAPPAAPAEDGAEAVLMDAEPAEPAVEAAQPEAVAEEETGPAEVAAEEETAKAEVTPEKAEPAATPTATGSKATPAAKEAAQAGSGAAPKAEFEAESIGGTGPLEGPPPQEFKFTDLSTGDITSWEWEFGDGETSTDQNPKHTIYRCPPNDLCTIKLTVCGPGGCDTEVKKDYLWVSEGCTGC